jgi:hypothetical protein
MIDVEQLIDGPGFVLIPNLMSAAEADEARSRVLELASSPSALELGKARAGQQHVRGLLAHGEIFERIVQHPTLIEIAEAMLGDDMTLGAYSARILHPGATEMGVHIDYPYWAMRGPFTLRPPLMVQVIWMLQDFTEHNGATLVAPRSQLRCARPNREQFARGDQDNGRRRRCDYFAWAAVARHFAKSQRGAARGRFDQLWPEGNSTTRYGDRES